MNLLSFGLFWFFPMGYALRLLQEPSDGSSSYEERVKSFVPQIVAEMVTGPLREESVALVLQEDQDPGNLGYINRPITLLRLPPASPDGGEKVAISNGTGNGEGGGMKRGPLKVGVIVLVAASEDESWSLLQSPPENWNTTAIVLVSTSTSCRKTSLLQTPLLFRTPSAALLCPYAPRKLDPQSRPLFRVWAWKPFVAADHLVDLGAWNPRDFSTWKRLFVDRFDDMSTKVVQVFAQTIDRPLFFRDSDGKLKGMNLEILGAMSSALGYSLNLTAEFELSWNQLLDPVREGKSEIFINFGLMTPERLQEFHMTVPYLLEGYGIMLQVPPLLPRWKNILYPFDLSVWIATVVSALSTSIAYHLLYREYEKSLINNAISIFQGLLSHSPEVIPEQWRTRLFLLLWSVSSWILNISYTSNLIAVLTIPVFPKKIETMQELADSHYRLCVLDYGDPAPEALKTSDHPVLASLGRKLDEVPLNHSFFFWGGIEPCVYKVLNGTHAHFDTYSFIQVFYHILGHDSVTYRMKERLYPGYLVFLIYKHAPWRFKIDVGIQRLTEAGLIQKWYQDTMEEFNDHHSEDRSIGQQAFKLSHLQGPFYILMGGVCISVMCFCSEHILPSGALL
ncbi:glutamate receptor ionotropic, kainate glr-3-like [Macrobrachium rosenbergii]|uniref:glutamate receptor ionotropic, kainate glr-3-like n=1 Tax=Macrobrachium rosenbergii TaxID=79674 RepID=UPI0034D62DDB